MRDSAASPMINSGEDDREVAMMKEGKCKEVPRERKEKANPMLCSIQGKQHERCDQFGQRLRTPTAKMKKPRRASWCLR